MPNHYPDRLFVIFNVSELSTIDFNQVYETSADTVRKSLDELETFVKYDSVSYYNESGSLVEPMPSSVEALTTKSQPYSYDEILVILSTPEWTDPNPLI
jgi:pyruvate/2-oxoglutarate dehydrogenase complex dihydrolipoamide dehydrogenase (E3) component